MDEEIPFQPNQIWGRAASASLRTLYGMLKSSPQKQVGPGATWGWILQMFHLFMTNWVHAAVKLKKQEHTEFKKLCEIQNIIFKMERVTTTTEYIKNGSQFII